MKVLVRTAVAAAVAIVLGATLVSTGSSTPKNQGGPFTVPGLWFGTLFFGPPDDPATPLLQFAERFDRDGSFTLDSTAETGQHPFIPGHASVGHGVWSFDGETLTTKLFSFSDGAAPPATFSLILAVGDGTFADGDTIVGRATTQSIPCPGGPLGCPDPTEVTFPSLPPINFTTVFPTVLKRVR